MRGKLAVGIIGLVILSLSWLSGEVLRPVAVSPGSEAQALVVEDVCPTFSWGAVAWASSYRLVMYELRGQHEGLLYYEDISLGRSPVIDKKIKGVALSWTPSREESLEPAVEYVWFVGAEDGSGGYVWSVGKRFKVELGESLLPEKKMMDKVPGRGAGLEETGEPVSRPEKGNVLGRLEKKKALVKDSKLPAPQQINTSDNKFIALGSENDGHNNVYYGSGAGNNLTSYSSSNSLFGMYAGYSLDTGDGNVFVGYTTGYSATSGSNNVFVGTYSGRYTTSGHSNTLVGFNSGYSNTTGNYNAFFGRSAGFNNTTGYHNTFIGSYSGFSNTTGYTNTFLGNYSGYSNTTGIRNTYIGYYSGYINSEGNNNVFIGYQTGHSNKGGYNTFIGTNSGYNNTGSSNVFIGYAAGYNEAGSNKLYIANSATSSPLIYGEFDNALLKVNGTLTVTESNINVETTENRARFRLQAAGGNYFNFTARNDYNDVTLSVWDASGSQWLPMLSYEYYNNKIDFKDNDLVTTGSISKGSGTFDIPHPDPAKKDAGWRLRHSFVESPTAGDNIYRYQVKVVGGQAVIKLPEYFKYLNENPQGWVSPVDVLGVARIEVDLEGARIYATIDGTYNVLIIGTRKDETAVRNWERYGVEYQRGEGSPSHK
ncbi:MAG: hypothetical protein J7L26_11025 [Candidatus Aminicenantes bacterium]|nr:hypothetical protein [Candidatus Aminicenantes bacterium]